MRMGVHKMLIHIQNTCFLFKCEIDGLQKKHSQAYNINYEVVYNYSN